MQSGSLYHIISRVNNQEFLLENHHIKAKYLSLLRLAKLKFDFGLLAYCIMDNHVHMLMKMNSDPISKVMQWVNLKFASSVNIKLDRNGHFFGARYHSTLIEDHFGVQQVIKYIHRNPIAAKMTNSLNYPWSSHNVYIGHPESSWFDANMGLETFNFGDSDAKSNYLRFVSEADDFERLIENDVLSERDVYYYENSQVPGWHEYVQKFPIIDAHSNVKGQLDLLFGRLCLMAKVDQSRVHKLIRLT